MVPRATDCGIPAKKPAVFVLAAVADLVIAEVPFHCAKRMLHLGPQRGLGPLHPRRRAQTRTAPQRFHFLQIIFHPRVAARVRELQVMHPQHHRQRVRRPTLAAARVERGNLGLQLLPRDQGIHARQELLTARGFLLQTVFQYGKSGLRVPAFFLSQLQAI